jgi:tryptophan halogenase
VREDTAIKRFVIAGGGTAGWMTAALARKYLSDDIEISLVESEDIGVVGVGEATIPPIQTFNRVLGIDEREFLKECKATIKLAIKFENWGRIGDSYYHTFGAPGTNLGFCGFQHYWERAEELGISRSLWEYDLHYQCCLENKFSKFKTSNHLMQLQYAYHFDSILYGKFLRDFAIANGVKRFEGIIQETIIDENSGYIKSLRLADQRVICGDFFIDCTGIKSLLLQRQMKVPYVDYKHWLPVNSAIAVQTDRMENLPPYTRSIARSNGWQWQIPLAHRTGNGMVYSSDYISDDQAYEEFASGLDGEMISDPRTIRFRTGRAEKQWEKNVVAIGLSSGFLEPLESTSIHLIQSSIVRLLKLFPTGSLSDAVVDMYNSESRKEFETIRDFIILHYFLNNRDDSEFWIDRRNMNIPERLALKIEAYRHSSIIENDALDIFRDASWLYVMRGQGIVPAGYNPIANSISKERLREQFSQIHDLTLRRSREMLSHKDFIEAYIGAQR